MTRMTIATEGVVLGVGYMIEPGALTWAESDGIEVTWEGDYSKVLGKAVNFRREGNLITADIKLNPLVHFTINGEEADFDLLVANPYVSPFERDSNNQQLVVHGIIRAVALQEKVEERVIPMEEL